MSDFEKHRTQADAQRAAARRRSSSVTPEQAVLRYLGVELYKERHHAEPTQDEESSDGSTDR